MAVKTASPIRPNQDDESCDALRRSALFCISSLSTFGHGGNPPVGIPFPSCHKPAQPVTITFFDSDARGVPGDHRMIPDAYLQEFTRETGIRVNDLPTPEDTGSKLDLAMDLLRSGAPSPDLYGVDTIWAGTMGEYLIDLQPYFASEISSEDPEHHRKLQGSGQGCGNAQQPIGVQVLIYRTDLARQVRLQNTTQNLG